ncbi:argininosuccinate lyase, partial [Enterocloster aldenensis]|nr:argininosuccinate lyase [Enterocloster aldenensis]
GVMASNQWVAIDNEDAGEDDEPDHYWYYFQANGKALTNGTNDKVSLKTVNGKKYAFDDEGRMLYGWVAEDNAERVDNTDGDGFKEGIYYFGGEDDGAMTVGWLQMDITYDEATDDAYKEIAPVFTDDEDQSRWFYFKSNGKKIYSESADETKDKTINGKKYAFDQYGAMVAEWSVDADKKPSTSSTASISTAEEQAKYSQAWRYYNSVEDGARVSKGWFKVVSAELLNEEKYNDDEDAWYYADGSGHLYAGEFKTIKGKKYAFRNDGRMIDGLKFIKDEGTSLDVIADDDDTFNFDNEDDFDLHAPMFEAAGYYCYYFGNGDDGAMRTNKNTVEIDGDKYNFYFEKSGGNKGAGLTGEKDDKYYQSGKLIKAGSDDKYQVVKVNTYAKNSDLDETLAEGEDITAYDKLDDVDAFLKDLDENGIAYYTKTDLEGMTDAAAKKILSDANINKKLADLKEVYIPKAELSTKDYFLVGTSGKVVDSKSRNKDGNDYYYTVNKKDGSVAGIYVED